MDSKTKKGNLRVDKYWVLFSFSRLRFEISRLRFRMRFVHVEHPVWETDRTIILEEDSVSNSRKSQGSGQDHRQNFGGPSVPSGSNSIFPMCVGGCNDGISTLCSHQDSLADEGVTEEIKPQTVSKHCFVPHRHKVLMRGLLGQSVHDSPVGLFACTRSGDVVVYVDNFTFPLTL